MACSLSSTPSCTWVLSTLSSPFSSSSSSSSSTVCSSAHRCTEIVPLPPPSKDFSASKGFSACKYSESKKRFSHISLPVTAAACYLFSVASSSHDPASASVSASALIASSMVEEWVSREPSNALSLPTWAIHVASVAEWVIAMALVWEYGDRPGNAAWKGLSWGMVPLLGGAMCACTWHFFYNAPSLEILVVAQAGLTFLGNFTMWLAAYRIYRFSLNKKLEK